MAAPLQPSWLSPTNPPFYSPPSLNRFYLFKPPSSLAPQCGPDSDSEESPSPWPSPPAPARVDPVKLAFERAKAYKMKSQQPPGDLKVQTGNGGSGEGREGGGQIALDKAGENLINEGNSDAGKVSNGSKEGTGLDFGKSNSGKKTNKEKLAISNVDFLGLDFADKKTTRGLPPGLVPISDPFPEGEMPDVEIIVGDTSKFDNSKASKQPVKEDDSDLYNPKVTSWGVFPRPSNISKTFGGGRVIRPGDVLETTEDRAAKEARTRELLAAYKKKIGLDIDAKLKSECQKALKDGDSLMDVGKLKEALPYYEQIMDKLPFRSEMYGLAALQWSICQDSLTRPNEARIMYEKLQSHPNANISKKARQFMFSFQAMEMMKLRSSRLSAESTGYQDYFKAFVDDKSAYGLDKNEVEEEGALSQVFPYIVFLLSPIFVVLVIALYKGI